MRLLLKLAFVFGMTIAIMIPLVMIRGTIGERQHYRDQAVANIARSSAGAQAFSGPVLVVPYVETIEVEEKNDDGEVVRKVKRDGESGRWTFFPDRFDVSGKLLPNTRRLGLHEVRVYELQALARAGFNVNIPADENPELPRRIGRPWLSYGIADVRGLAGTPRLRVDGRDMALEEGFGSRDSGGVHVRLPAPAAGAPLRLDTALDMKLAGTESLALVPLGRSNVFRLESTWPHPRFGGDFLPRQPGVGDKGFTAQWEVSSLASNAQAQFLAGKTLPAMDAARGYGRGASDNGPAFDTGGIDAVGVALVDPVNVYSQADRASKYGLLFVVLTFVGFFMFELIKQLPIHPVQYGLVGLALAIFFLLLVSLSEHIAFAWAYLVASVACIGLLGFYLSAVLRSVARGLGFAAMLATLYAALYGLLVSEDNALVLGSGLLFVILAAIMVITRKVDWYQLGNARPLAASV
ncbi:cell envelope integrity protein CreD [Lysobacter solisilvae (ex Woo and Kim 2022)]|uniref:Cell envelope integrity protein CreD n=1 Tax=Agrilutibacter terrestris TaxID=2865112 RepID=A0A7H0FVR1_9GAMM|nr:cell envelope integrity protein CreD [Lysobacter terrestris]QNP40127.1 cell envelope integrity protein CreD [Lysobacter terrestris]